MDVLNWLVACIPILSFGLIPVIATYIGGKAVEQSMGIALGGFIFAIAMFLIKRPELTPQILLVSFISGFLWAIGSIGQFLGINYLGVVKSMPINNGGQIIGTSLFGVLLGEWATTHSKIFGFSALALIILGMILTSYKDKENNQETHWKKGLLINLVSVLGFTFYVGILKYYSIDGWSGILPQSFGQIVGMFLISVLFFKVMPFNKPSAKNGVVGLIWGGR